MYLDSLALINFSLSIDLVTSWPQIGQYGTWLGTPVGSFGDPFALVFHNSIGGLSMGVQMLTVGETLYCITSQQNESTKDLKICILICPTKVSEPSFKQLRT
jgi:hypothetical protein